MEFVIDKTAYAELQELFEYPIVELSLEETTWTSLKQKTSKIRFIQSTLAKFGPDLAKSELLFEEFFEFLRIEYLKFSKIRTRTTEMMYHFIHYLGWDMVEKYKRELLEKLQALWEQKLRTLRGRASYAEGDQMKVGDKKLMFFDMTYSYYLYSGVVLPSLNQLISSQGFINLAKPQSGRALGRLFEPNPVTIDGKEYISGGIDSAPKIERLHDLATSIMKGKQDGRVYLKVWSRIVEETFNQIDKGEQF